MIKTALITFHAPYNYGSVLQAYALQQTIISLGFENTIINYRFQEQKNCYSLVRKGGGIADVIKDILQLPVFPLKKVRGKKFEDFIRNKLILTAEFSDPVELESIKNDYNVFISGSDQIWNKHANELHNVDWRYMDPYLLDFTQQKKISYASSIGGMENEEIEKISPKLLKFCSISAREKSVSKHLSKLLNRDVFHVIDPTLLLDEKTYVDSFALKRDRKKYIFYYSLSGINTVSKHIKWLKKMVLKTGYEVIVNTPYAYIPLDGKMRNYVDMGPVEFMECILNANFIVTDSFHGTAFAINFSKDFYSICKFNGRSEYRKVELLESLALDDRVIYNLEEVKDLKATSYKKATVNLKGMRKMSIEYLKTSL